MARDEEAYRNTLVALDKLTRAQDWRKLRAKAEDAAARFPDSADRHALVAHACRQLNQLEPGYEWALRARAIDPNSLFAINRVSLLAVLTGRAEEAYASIDGVLDREVTTAADKQNLALAISNAI